MNKHFWNACLGNLFEHYDAALFGFLSPFLAPLIFPQHDPITALILTYAITPLGLLARPLGALLFGYIGDTYGRERSLFLSLTGMGLISGCFALIPTYPQVGLLAPILFCIGKAFQNFFTAGETMGGAIFILENSSEKRHDLLSSLYSSSSIAGHLLASLGVYAISQFSTVDPGWRFLYLAGCITALFGCLLRRPTSAYAPSPTKSPPLSIGNLWSNRKALLIIILSSGFAYGTYSIALVLMNGLVPLVSSLTKAEMMKINTYLLVMDCCTFPLFGWIASKISREKLMLSVCLSTLLLSTPLLMSLEGGSMAVVVGVRMIFVFFGVAFFAPYHAWVQTLVPEQGRFVNISFGYAIGTQALGSPTAAIALWCFKTTGMISSVAWYWMFLALASALSIGVAMRSKSEIRAQN